MRLKKLTASQCDSVSLCSSVNSSHRCPVAGHKLRSHPVVGHRKRVRPLEQQVRVVNSSSTCLNRSSVQLVGAQRAHRATSIRPARFRPATVRRWTPVDPVERWLASSACAGNPVGSNRLSREPRHACASAGRRDRANRRQRLENGVDRLGHAVDIDHLDPGVRQVEHAENPAAPGGRTKTGPARTGPATTGWPRCRVRRLGPALASALSRIATASGSQPAAGRHELGHDLAQHRRVQCVRSSPRA